MPVIVTCAFAGCGKDFETRQHVQRFCSRSCGLKSRPGVPAFSLASLRFHLRRAGGRTRFADLTGIPLRRVDRDAPQDDTDAYHRGEMASIGGILVKKCARCEVARQLESFHVDSHNRSGCRPICAICREKDVI